MSTSGSRARREATRTPPRGRRARAARTRARAARGRTRIGWHRGLQRGLDDLRRYLCAYTYTYTRVRPRASVTPPRPRRLHAGAMSCKRAAAPLLRGASAVARARGPACAHPGRSRPIVSTRVQPLVSEYAADLIWGRRLCTCARGIRRTTQESGSFANAPASTREIIVLALRNLAPRRGRAPGARGARRHSEDTAGTHARGV